MARSSSLSCLLLILSFLSTFATVLSAPARNEVPPKKRLLMPNEDAFYNNTLGFEKAKPGTILGHRRVPNPITIDNTNSIVPKNAWQIKYRTQNSLGVPSETIVTVLEPFNAKKDALFLYHFFSDASWNGCNPSLALQTGTPQDNSFTQLQTLFIIEALSKGWYVSVPDDGGMQAAFGAGLQWGYATLDSIRAVRASGNITGISDDPTVSLYGYSGGASAAGWATELQPTYAPDVRIDGAAIGGLIPNFGILAESLNGVERSRFLPATTLGIAHDYPNMTAWLAENLVPEYEAEFRRADHQCFDSNNNMYAGIDIGKYFKNGYGSLMNDTVPNSVRHWAGTMGNRGPPKVPWYLFQAVGDDASPIGLTDLLYEKHCANGATIVYERNPRPLNHSMECIAGLPGAFEYLSDIHNRVPNAVPPGCHTVGVSFWSLRSVASLSPVQGWIDDALAWFGQPLGPAVDAKSGKDERPAWDWGVIIESLKPKNNTGSETVKPWSSPLGAVPVPPKGGSGQPPAKRPVKKRMRYGPPEGVSWQEFNKFRFAL
ncbi:LIP-domain-containing protein [Tothia fuscella]|uniref:LIP-domain-containing protein n=1 Tax=Tothia fuscella TaxID=1048955 RepID=A0A9P4NPJ0_9PEZI|nr:LIP-domain-containing protein [Tothia fuscella]